MAGRMARSLTSWPDQIPLSEGWKTNLVAAEKSMIVRALKMSDGNKLKAAETLNIHRRLLYEKMREYGCRGWNALGL
jgi:transcriptional regulator with PAS, ATPase and Fis domain